MHALEKELPLVCTDFFRSVSQTTSTLTRLSYAYDYRLFFDYLQKGRREIGQVMSDWRSRMPSREPHGTIQDTIARICRLANEDARTKRKELVEMWLDQGVYSANGL